MFKVNLRELITAYHMPILHGNQYLYFFITLYLIKRYYLFDLMACIFSSPPVYSYYSKSLHVNHTHHNLMHFQEQNKVTTYIYGL